MHLNHLIHLIWSLSLLVQCWFKICIFINKNLRRVLKFKHVNLRLNYVPKIWNMSISNELWIYQTCVSECSKLDNVQLGEENSYQPGCRTLNWGHVLLLSIFQMALCSCNRNTDWYKLVWLAFVLKMNIHILTCFSMFSSLILAKYFFL